MQQKDFKVFLQDRLLQNCRSNPNYSLRAFARSLNISPSALSGMLNGKRSITDKMKLRLGSALGLETHEILKFNSGKKGRADHSKNYHRMALDVFAMISDWYHFAILELTRVVGFQSSAEYISKKLGITKSEANFAIERLKRLGFLIVENGRWVDASPNEGSVTNINADLSSMGSKKLQRQILEKSIQALESIPLEKRNHTSMTMVMDSKRIEEAVKFIAEFRRKFCREFESVPHPDHVYNLHIGFYPVTCTKEQT